MKYGFIYFLIAACSGGSFLAYEVVCASMLHPYFGSSFHVWAAVLSVSVTSLAIGYMLMTRLEFRNRTKALLVICSLSMLYMLSSPYIFDVLIHVTEDQSYLLATWITVISLILIPGILCGLVTPLIISFNLIEDTGKNSGFVYGTSTLSSLAYTLIAGFCLIPMGHVHQALLYLILPLAVLVVILYVLHQYWIILIVSYAALAGIILIGNKNEGKIPQEIYSSNGMLGHVRIIDFTGGNPTRLMMVNGMGQTWVRKSDNNSVWSYVNYVTAASGLAKEKPSILLIGLGGGVLANQLSMTHGTQVDAVELDERVASCAKNYFGLSPLVNVILDDGRHYLHTSDKKYDLVVFDVFSGDVAPSQLLSIECFEQVQQKLNPGGIFVINFNGFEKIPEGYGSRVLHKTLVESGFKTHVVPTFEEERYRNTIFISSLHNLDISRSRFSVTLNGSQYQLSQLEANPQRWFTKKKAITDDRPVMEQLNYKASLKWREDFRTFLKKELGE